MSATVASLIASLGLDAGPFKKGIGEAKKGAGDLGSAITSVGGTIKSLVPAVAALGAGLGAAFSVGKSVDAVKALAANVTQMKREIGVTAEEASKLAYAMDKTVPGGAAAGERGLVKFGKALAGVADLEDGVDIAVGKSMVGALKSLGVAAEDAKGNMRPMQEVLGTLADKFKAMPDGAEKTALAMQFFGKSGKDLIPLLNQGKAGLGALSAEASKFGLVLDDKALASVKAFGLAQKNTNAALKGLQIQLGLAVLPVLTIFAQYAAQAAAALNEHLMPVFRAIGPVLMKVVDAFTHAVTTLTKFKVVAAGLSGAGLVLLIVGLKMLAVMVWAVISPFLAAIGLALSAAAPFIALAVVVGILVEKFGLLDKAKSFLSAFMAEATLVGHALMEIFSGNWGPSAAKLASQMESVFGRGVTDKVFTFVGSVASAVRTLVDIFKGANISTSLQAMHGALAEAFGPGVATVITSTIGIIAAALSTLKKLFGGAGLAEALTPLNEALAAVFGPDAAGKITGGIQMIGDAVGRLFGWLKGTGGPAVLAALGVAFGVLLAVASAVWDGIVTVVTTAISVIGAVIGAVVGWVTDNWTTIVAVAAAIWTAVSDTVMTVLTGLLAVIVAVVTWVSDNWSTIVDVATAIWTGIVTVVGAVLAGLLAVIMAVVTWVTDNWGTISAVAIAIWTGIVAGVTAAIQFLSDVIGAVVGWVQDHWGQITDIAMTIWNGIVTAVGAALDGLQTVIGAVVGWVQDHWGQISDIATAVWNGIVDVVTTVIDTVRNVVGGVVDFIRDNWGTISDTAGRAFDLVVSLVTGAIDQIKQLISSVREWWEQNGEEIKGAAGRIWDFIVAAVGVAIDIVKGILLTIAVVVGAVVATAMVLWNEFGDTILQVIKNAISIVTTVIQTIVKIVGDVISLVVALINGDWKGAWEAAKTIVADLIEGILTIIRKMIENIGEIIKGAANAIGDLGKLLFDKGVQMVQGLIDGVKSMAGKATGAAKELAGDVAGAFADRVKVWSPSRVFFAYGQFISEGAALGIYDKTPMAVQAVTDMADDMVAAGAKMGQVFGTIGPATGAGDSLTKPFKDAADAASDLAGVVSADVVPAYGDLAAMLSGDANMFDDVRTQMRGNQAELKATDAQLLALHRTLLLTPAADKATRDAINGQIQTLQSYKQELSGSTAELHTLLTEMAQGTTAASGFGNVMNSLGKDAETVKQFGVTGAAAIQAFDNALMDDSPKAGADAAKALSTVIAAAKAAAVPGWQGMADEASAAFGLALESHSEGDIRAALAWLQRIQDATIAQTQLNGTTFQTALSTAYGTQALSDMLGPWAAGFDALTKAWHDGGAANVQAAAKWEADMLTALGKLPADVGGPLADQMRAAFDAFIANPSTEGLAAIQRLSLESHNAVTLIPKDFAKLAPEIQGYILDLIAKVDSGAMQLADATTLAGDAAKLIPAGFKKMVPELQSVILDIVRALQSGKIDMDTAIAEIADAQNLIPKNLHDLTPAVQSDILRIVEAWESGAVSITEATKQIAAAVKASADATKAAADTATHSLQNLIQTQYAASHTGSPSGATSSTHLTGGPTGTDLSSAVQADFGGIAGLIQSTITDSFGTFTNYSFPQALQDAYGGNISAIMYDMEHHLGVFMSQSDINSRLSASAAALQQQAAATNHAAATTGLTAATQTAAAAGSMANMVDVNAGNMAQFGGHVDDFGQIVDGLNNLLATQVETQHIGGNAVLASDQEDLNARRAAWSAQHGGAPAPFARGGTIWEQIMGVGLQSGRRYSFGENGPETITPGAHTVASLTGSAGSSGGAGTGIDPGVPTVTNNTFVMPPNPQAIARAERDRLHQRRLESRARGR